MSSNPYAPRPAGPRGDGLADVLERVLDKGLVIAGDIQLSLLDIEVLTLKVRLLVASADTAQQMGIDWWRRDPFLSSEAADREPGELAGGTGGSDRELTERSGTNGQPDVAALERRIAELEQRLAQQEEEEDATAHDQNGPRRATTPQAQTQADDGRDRPRGRTSGDERR